MNVNTMTLGPARPRTLQWVLGVMVVVLVAALVGPAMRDAGAVGRPSGCVAAPSGAYHVAKSGSDSSGNGSANKPWRTIGHAVDRARSGSTIVVHAGTYRESVVIRSKRLNLMSAPGETAWLSGSDPVSGWTKSGATWQATPPNRGADRRSAFDGKRMLDSSHMIAGHLAMVFIDGAPQRQVSSVGDVGPGTFAVKSGVYHLGTNPSGKTVDVAHREVGLFIDNASGSQIIGMGFRHYATPEVVDGAVRIAVDSANVSVVDSVFVNNANVGLQVRGTRARIENNTFENNGRLAISANNADDLLVRGNYIKNNNNEHFDTSAAAGAVKVSASRRVDIAANHILENTGAGVWIDRSSLDIDITRNRSENNSKHAFHVEASARVRVVSNSSVDDQIGVRVSDSNDVDVWNNVVIGAVQHISAQDGPRDSATAQGGSFGLPHDNRFSFPIPGISWILEDLTVRNNLFVGGTGGNPMLYVNDSAGDMYGNEMAKADHNIFHRGFKGDPKYVVGWSGGPDSYDRYRTVAEWKADQGQGSGDIQKSGSTLGSVKNFPSNLAPAGPAVGAGRDVPSGIAGLVGYNGGTPPIGLLTANNGPYGHCTSGGGSGGGGGGGGCPSASTRTFADVERGSFYENAVAWLVATGATTGTGPTTFSPYRPITRGEAATFLYRLACSPRTSTNASAIFTDVPPGAYYTDAVGWLIETGATSGTSPTTFSPSRLITRGEAATLLHRLDGARPASAPTVFADVPRGAFFETAVGWLVQSGATTGTSPTTFSPERLITRGEAATLLHRLDTSGELKLR